MQAGNKLLGTPSVTVTTSYEKLTDRITTRVMAMKIMKQKELEDNIHEKEKSLAKVSSGKSLRKKVRQPSKFLLGTSIPNSIIKSEIKRSITVQKEDRDTARAKRDASVKEIMQRLESRQLFSSNDVLLNNDISSKLSINSNEPSKNLDDDQNKSSTKMSQASIENTEYLDALREELRIRRRTTLLPPITCQRQSTVQDIVDVDCLRNRQLSRSEVRNSSPRNASRVTSPSWSKRHSLTLTPTQRFDALFKVSSKSSKMNRRSTTSSGNLRKKKSQDDNRKSILKQGSRENFKPMRNVLIVDNNKEDSQTQTYLRMKDFT